MTIFMGPMMTHPSAVILLVAPGHQDLQGVVAVGAVPDVKLQRDEKIERSHPNLCTFFGLQDFVGQLLMPVPKTFQMNTVMPVNL